MDGNCMFADRDEAVEQRAKIQRQVFCCCHSYCHGGDICSRSANISCPPPSPSRHALVSIVNGREKRHDGHRKNRRRIMGGTSWYTNSFLVPVHQNRIPLPPHTKATEKMMRCLALRTLHHPRRYAGAPASMFPGARFAHKNQRLTIGQETDDPAHKNQFNFSDRACQTPITPYRELQVQNLWFRTPVGAPCSRALR